MLHDVIYAITMLPMEPEKSISVLMQFTADIAAMGFEFCVLAPILSWLVCLLIALELKQHGR